MKKVIRPIVLMAALIALAGGTVTTAQDKTKPAAKDDKKADGKDKVGSVEVYKGKEGFRFRIKNAEGKVVAMPPLTKSYTTKDEAYKVLDEIKATLNAAKPTEVKE